MCEAMGRLLHNFGGMHTVCTSKTALAPLNSKLVLLPGVHAWHWAHKARHLCASVYARKTVAVSRLSARTKVYGQLAYGCRQSNMEQCICSSSYHRPEEAQVP